MLDENVLGVMMARRLKKGDLIEFKHGSGEFTPGCEYMVEKCHKEANVVDVFDDEGNYITIDYPLDPERGLFS